MDWFDKHRFYLGVNVCNEVNYLKPKAEAHLGCQEWVKSYNDFVPDPDMDQSYFS